MRILVCVHAGQRIRIEESVQEMFFNGMLRPPAAAKPLQYIIKATKEKVGRSHDPNIETCDPEVESCELRVESCNPWVAIV